jgi:predicted enzyme related to lactoylglutathione lyase
VTAHLSAPRPGSTSPPPTPTAPSSSTARCSAGRSRRPAPTGAFFGLWQPTGHQGFEVVNEDGAPVYHQLTTRDYVKALDFYREVFGWQTETVSDTDEFRYSTASFDGDPLVGVMDGSSDLSGGAPSNWFFFLGAEDVDKTVQLVKDNGGSVIRDAEDTPYGRLAAVADPTGAGFNLSSLDQ